MTTKRYRAATMREALEKVKQELGENALVLDKKHVRTDGFFGLGAREVVELHVAADTNDVLEDEELSPTPLNAAAKSYSGAHLSLADDSPAVPAGFARNNSYAARSERNLVTPLVDQNTVFAELESSETTKSHTTPPSPASTRTVEIAETAPRIVHRSPTTAAAASSSSAAHIDAKELAPSAFDLNRLHAELREVKFTLGSLLAKSPALDPAAAHAALSLESEFYDSPNYEAYAQLTAAGLPHELARHIIRHELDSVGAGDANDPDKFAHAALVRWLTTYLPFAVDPLAPPSEDGVEFSPVMVFVGPTGVGKTTTIAKLAARVALRQRRRVELVTFDTYRIAAAEQLKTYAEIIGANCHVATSILELDALTRRSAGQATVLVDTTGRSPHDLADQMELADYMRANNDFFKCLVLQATTQPSDAQVAADKFAMYGVNHLVVTKYDETNRPGSSIGVAAEIGLPLLYSCIGQRVPEDIEPATPKTLASRILRFTPTANAYTA